MDTATIVERLYGKRALRPSRGPWWPVRRASTWLGRALRLRRLKAWVRRRRWYLALTVVLLAGWAMVHIYYFNMLVNMESNVQTAWAQVEAEEQRRDHIEQNLSRMLAGYARHERDLLHDLTELRTEARRRPTAPAPEESTEPGTVAEGSSGAPAGSGLAGMSADELKRILPQISMNAEQYPNLRLSENFQQYAAVVVETESRIAQDIKAYNDFVNEYTNVIDTFPGKIFALIWGFKSYDCYAPAAAAKRFSPLRFEDGWWKGAETHSTAADGRAQGGMQ